MLNPRKYAHTSIYGQKMGHISSLARSGNFDFFKPKNRLEL